MAPEHDARTRAFYDHESDEPRRRRRRAAADWGVSEDIFDRMPSRRFTRSDRRAEHREDADAHRFERRVSGPSPPRRRGPTKRRAARTRGADEALPLRRDDWADEHERRQIAPRTAATGPTATSRAARRTSSPRSAARPASSSAAPATRTGADAAPSRGPSPTITCRSRTASARSTRGWSPTPGRNWRSRPARAGPSCSRRRPSRSTLVEEPPGRRTVTITGHPDRMPVPRTQRPPRTAIERIGASPDRIVGYAVAARVRARADRRSHHWSIIDVRALAGLTWQT